MSGDRERELEKFALEIQSGIASTEKTIMAAMEGLEKRCLENSMDDVDRYVGCMSKTIKKVEKEESKFQYRMGFLQHKLHNCLNQQEKTSKNYEICRNESRETFKRFLEEFTNGLKN